MSDRPVEQNRRPKVAACIFVRLNSSRLPYKGLADVSGKPMLLRIIERLRRAGSIDEIVICTSDRPEDAVLLDLAREWGVTAVAGAELDLVSRFILAARKTSADIVLRVTGDNIFTDPENIDRMVREHIARGAEYTRTSGLPLGMTAEILSVAMLPRLYEVIPNVAYSEYLLLYAFDPTRFRCLVLDAPPELKRPYYSVTVDTQEDLDLVRTLFAMSPSPDGPRTCEEVIRLLDGLPGRGRLDGSSPIRMPGGQVTTWDELLRMLDARAEIAKHALAVSAVHSD